MAVMWQMPPKVVKVVDVVVMPQDPQGFRGCWGSKFGITGGRWSRDKFH